MKQGLKIPSNSEIRKNRKIREDFRYGGSVLSEILNRAALWLLRLWKLAFLLLLVGACSMSSSALPDQTEELTSVQSSSAAEPAGKETGEPKETDEILEAMEEETMIELEVNGVLFDVEPASSQAAQELLAELKKEEKQIQMHDYGSFEKVGSLGKNYPASDTNLSAEPGDLMLYTGNQLVLFYGNNRWAYTRLGKITDPQELKEALGSGDVTITLRAKQ